MLPPIVEVAISVIIAWGLFAVLCSIVHEALVQAKGERGRFLKRYLLRQLQDKPNGINWATMLYTHGTIDLLSRAPEKPTSDISPKLFAETMIDVVANSPVSNREKKELDAKYFTDKILNDYKAATELWKESDVVAMLRQAIRHAEVKAGRDVSARESDNAGPDESMVYQYLVSYLENWYNEMMERVSIWYKKTTRKRLFILGVLLAAVLNINSLALYEHFDRQPRARAAMMEFYERYVVYEPGSTDSAGNEIPAIVRLDVNIGEDTTAHTGDSAQGTGAPKQPYEKQLVKAYQQLKKDAMLPVGWEHTKPLVKMDLGEILMLWAGIFITGVAASFGAPFWFDILKKATRFTKPDKSKDAVH